MKCQYCDKILQYGQLSDPIHGPLPLPIHHDHYAHLVCAEVYSLSDLDLKCRTCYRIAHTETHFSPKIIPLAYERFSGRRAPQFTHADPELKNAWLRQEENRVITIFNECITETHYLRHDQIIELISEIPANYYSLYLLALLKAVRYGHLSLLDQLLSTRQQTGMLDPLNTEDDSQLLLWTVAESSSTNPLAILECLEKYQLDLFENVSLEICILLATAITQKVNQLQKKRRLQPTPNQIKILNVLKQMRPPEKPSLFMREMLGLLPLFPSISPD